MKINKIFLGMAFAAVALFTACDQDNEAAIYNLEGQGLAFTSNSLGQIEVEPSDPVCQVPIVRGNAKGAFTGKVGKVTAEVDGEEVDYNTVCSVGDFTFADGACQTSFDVNVAPLPVGKVLTLTLECTDNLAPTAGTNVVTMKINKKYVWESAGTCTFIDYTFTEDENGVKAEGVAVEHAQETSLYRIIQPWIACYGGGAEGFTKDTGVQFKLNSDNSIDLVPVSGSIVATADQYDFCWVANYVGSYCLKGNEGNDYWFSMLGLVDGDGYYTGFAFEFIWNR